MDMTAIRLVARSEINLAGSATVCRSRVEPAPRDAAKPGTRDRRTGRHIPLKPTRFPAIPWPGLPATRGGRPRPKAAGGWGSGVLSGYDLGRHAAGQGLQSLRPGRTG